MRSFIDNLNRSHEVLIDAYNDYLNEPGLRASASVQQKADTAQFFFDRAAECIDISQVGDSLKTSVQTEVTLLLKEVLDRIDRPYYSDIPDREAILDWHEKDLALNQWEVPKTEIEIVKVDEGERGGEYLFSPETVRHAREFYHKVKKLPYKPGATEGFYEFYISTPGQLLPPKWFRFLPASLNRVYGGQTLWQWFGMIAALLINGVIILLLFQWNERRISKLHPVTKDLARTIPAVLSMILLLFVGNWINYELNITGDILIAVLNVVYMSWWFMLAFILFFVSQVGVEALIAYLERRGGAVDTALIRAFADLISWTIGGAVMLFGVQRLGANLFPLLAGLGVGGVAVALGAQSTLENVIAGLALFIDQPVVAGEECIFGEDEGVVQSIGLRSIRLEGTDGNLISMPNSAFSQLQLTNKSRSTKSLFKHCIHLSYQTTSEQLELVLEKFLKLLEDNPQTLEDGRHVRCVAYSEYSIVIELQTYIDTTDGEEFLAIQQGLLLTVKRIVEEVGTEFAVGV